MYKALWTIVLVFLSCVNSHPIYAKNEITDYYYDAQEFWDNEQDAVIFIAERIYSFKINDPMYIYLDLVNKRHVISFGMGSSLETKIAEDEELMRELKGLMEEPVSKIEVILNKEDYLQFVIRTKNGLYSMLRYYPDVEVLLSEPFGKGAIDEHWVILQMERP